MSVDIAITLGLSFIAAVFFVLSRVLRQEADIKNAGASINFMQLGFTLLAFIMLAFNAVVLWDLSQYEATNAVTQLLMLCVVFLILLIVLFILGNVLEFILYSLSLWTDSSKDGDSVYNDAEEYAGDWNG